MIDWAGWPLTSTRSLPDGPASLPAAIAVGVGFRDLVRAGARGGPPAGLLPADQRAGGHPLHDPQPGAFSRRSSPSPVLGRHGRGSARHVHAGDPGAEHRRGPRRRSADVLERPTAWATPAAAALAGRAPARGPAHRGGAAPGHRLHHRARDDHRDDQRRVRGLGYFILDGYNRGGFPTEMYAGALRRSCSRWRHFLFVRASGASRPGPRRERSRRRRRDLVAETAAWLTNPAPVGGPGRDPEPPPGARVDRQHLARGLPSCWRSPRDSRSATRGAPGWPRASEPRRSLPSLAVIALAIPVTVRIDRPGRVLPADARGNGGASGPAHPRHA